MKYIRMKDKIEKVPNDYAKQLLYNLVHNIPFVFTGKGEELK